jgi:hypothetical protein
MRSADAEPNTWEAFSGQDGYRLFRVADRSADHDRRFLSATVGREGTSQVAWLPQLPSKARSYFQVAQTMRASRLASATVALL